MRDRLRRRRDAWRFREAADLEAVAARELDDEPADVRGGERAVAVERQLRGRERRGCRRDSQDVIRDVRRPAHALPAVLPRGKRDRTRRVHARHERSRRLCGACGEARRAPLHRRSIPQLDGLPRDLRHVVGRARAAAVEGDGRGVRELRAHHARAYVRAAAVGPDGREDERPADVHRGRQRGRRRQRGAGHRRHRAALHVDVGRVRELHDLPRDDVVGDAGGPELQVGRGREIARDGVVVAVFVRRVGSTSSTTARTPGSWSSRP